MQLLVISAAKQASYDIEWIDCNTAQGNFVIQENHAPTIFVLEPDSIVTFLVHEKKTITQISVKQGVLDITREKIILLITQDK